MSRQPNNDFDIGLLFGILFGVVAILLFAAALGFHEGFFDWLEKYQTLVGSIIALASAAGTVLVVRRQIVQADSQHADGLRRKHIAARAILPLSLARLSDYATSSVKALLSIYRDMPDDRSEPLSQVVHDMPVLPDDVIQNLKENIEYGNESGESALSALIVKLQVQHSRLDGAFERLADGSIEWPIYRDYIEDYLLDALEIYARCALLFDYARKKDNHPHDEVTDDDIYSAAANCGLDTDEINHLLGRASSKRRQTGREQ